MRQSRSVIICGGGVIGLSCAYYLAREGWRVTVVERNAEGADTCAHGSAGFVSPSHVIPLAAPGMVWKGLKWMMSSRSPFYIKPRLDGDLMRWGWLFARACNERHVRRSAPVLRDLCLGGRKLFVDWADITGNSFELKTEGLLNLCQTQAGLDHEAHGLRPWPASWASRRRCWTRRRPPRWSRGPGSRWWARFIFPSMPTSRRAG